MHKKQRYSTKTISPSNQKRSTNSRCVCKERADLDCLNMGVNACFHEMNFQTWAIRYKKANKRKSGGENFAKNVCKQFFWNFNVFQTNPVWITFHCWSPTNRVRTPVPIANLSASWKTTTATKDCDRDIWPRGERPSIDLRSSQNEKATKWTDNEKWWLRWTSNPVVYVQPPCLVSLDAKLTSWNGVYWLEARLETGGRDDYYDVVDEEEVDVGGLECEWIDFFWFLSLVAIRSIQNTWL